MAVDLPLLEHGIARLDRAVDGTALDLHPLLAQAHLLLDRALGDVAAHPDAAPADLALADPQLLLGPLDHVLVTAGAQCCSAQARAGRGAAHVSSAIAAMLLVAVVALEAHRLGRIAHRVRRAVADAAAASGRAVVARACGRALTIGGRRGAGSTCTARRIASPAALTPALGPLVHIDRIVPLQDVGRLVLQRRPEPCALSR